MSMLQFFGLLFFIALTPKLDDEDRAIICVVSVIVIAIIWIGRFAIWLI